MLLLVLFIPIKNKPSSKCDKEHNGDIQYLLRKYACKISISSHTEASFETLNLKDFVENSHRSQTQVKKCVDRRQNRQKDVDCSLFTKTLEILHRRGKNLRTKYIILFLSTKIIVHLTSFSPSVT